jgi:hypothetical protein
LQVLVGLPVNLFAIVALILAINTWSASFFGLFDLPECFRVNATAVAMAANTSVSAANTSVSVVDILFLNTTLAP